MLHKLASRFILLFTLSGLTFTFAGCETMSGLGSDIGGLYGSIMGDDNAYGDLEFFDSLSDETEDAKSEVKSARAELDEMRSTPGDEIDEQYAKYNAAVADLKAQSASLDARIDAAERQAKQHLDDLVSKAREDSPAAGQLAEQIRKNNSKEFSAIFAQARSAQNQIAPLINAMDASASKMQSTAKTQGDQATAGDTDLNPIKKQVDTIVKEMDQTVESIEEGELKKS